LIARSGKSHVTISLIGCATKVPGIEKREITCNWASKS